MSIFKLKIRKDRLDSFLMKNPLCKILIKSDTSLARKIFQL